MVLVDLAARHRDRRRSYLRDLVFDTAVLPATVATHRHSGFKGAAREEVVKWFRRRAASHDLSVPRGVAPPTGLHSAGVTDCRVEGPEEARKIVSEHRACETAQNGTGSRCLCGFDCANYWLRSRGYRA